MHSINRLFFLSLGSVCFLIVPFFWLALAFDFSALENFVITLSHTKLVGYPIPELLGSAKGDPVVDKVSRIEYFFTIIAIAYSLFFVGLSYLEETRKRVNYCARGVAIPLFLLILGFWLNFIGDDHIISKEEKTELFQYTTTCFIISALLFTYSFRSEKKEKPEKIVTNTENDADDDKEPMSKDSDASTTSGNKVLPPPDGVTADASPAAPATVESEPLAPPDDEVLPPPDGVTADANPAASLPVESEPLPPPESNENEGEVPGDSSSENEFLENLGLDKTQSSPPAADSGAASYQFPPEADDSPDENQVETDAPPKIVEEEDADPKPPPL